MTGLHLAFTPKSPVTKDCFATIRDLRVKIAELEKELILLRELKRALAGSEVWDTWKKHGGKFNE